MSLDYLKAWPGKIDLPLLQKIQAQNHRAWHTPEGKRYRQLLGALPPVPGTVNVHQGRVQITGSPTAKQQELIEHSVRQLKNWKKGPFELFHLTIDSEWRSDLKWQRLEPKLGSLTDQVVLDIGCNNGYFMYRMRQAGAKIVLGIDPTLHFKAQFELLQFFAPTPNLHFELFGIDQLTAFSGVFDSIFSLGILYHHPHPLQQLQDVYHALKPGGKLLLETIGIAGNDPIALCPEGRYARMRNIWFLPTLPTLLHWMKRAAFKHLSVISTQWQREREQRSTPWSAPVSYQSFLATDNPHLTIEGHPAPERFIVCGQKP